MLSIQFQRQFGALAFLLLGIGLYNPLFADSNPTLGQARPSLVQEVGEALLTPEAEAENAIPAFSKVQPNVQVVPAITLAISFLPINASTSRLSNGAFSTLSRAVRPTVAAIRTVPTLPLASCLLCPPTVG